MEDLYQKPIFPDTITFEAALSRAMDLYMCLIRAMIRMQKEGSLTEYQVDQLMVEVRAYVNDLD